MSAKRFERKIALVTGAARGIGLAIASRLLAEGATVYFADIDADVAERAVEPLAPTHRAFSLRIDIAHQQSVGEAVGRIAERHGKLDILVNNGAVLDETPFDELDYSHFQAIMRVNLDGALLCVMACVPLMEEVGGGRILNISSVKGLYGAPDSIPYATAKAGIVNLTRCLCCDLADKAITVNALAPGFIDTRMARLRDGSHEHLSEEFKTVYLKYKHIPIGRAGTPEDLAGPAAFLVSDDARYVTGQTLLVDGGLSARY